jgi:hypothetical protein
MTLIERTAFAVEGVICMPLCIKHYEIDRSNYRGSTLLSTSYIKKRIFFPEAWLDM